MDAPNLMPGSGYTPFKSPATKVATAGGSRLRTKVATGMAIVGVASAVAAAVVAGAAGEQESARTFIWVLLAGSGLAPLALVVGRIG